MHWSRRTLVLAVVCKQDSSQNLFVLVAFPERTICGFLIMFSISCCSACKNAAFHFFGKSIFSNGPKLHKVLLYFATLATLEFKCRVRCQNCPRSERFQVPFSEFWYISNPFIEKGEPRTYFQRPHIHQI